MKKPWSTYSEDGTIVTFHAGRFHFTAEGNRVIVSKTGAGPIDIVIVTMYEYRDGDEAIDSAYGMAWKQANA